MNLPFLQSYSEESKTMKKLKDYDHSQIPKFYKVPKNGSIFDDLYNIQDNVSRSLTISLTGEEKCNKKNSFKKGTRNNDMRIGERTFFESGTCGPTSTPECVNQSRYIPVDTIPSGNFQKKKDFEDENAPKQSKNGGLIPGIIEDVISLNPLEIVHAITGKSSRINDKCKSIDFVEKQMRPTKKPLIAKSKICVPYKSSLNPIQENFQNINIQKNNKKKYIIFIYLFIFASLLFFFIQNYTPRIFTR